MRASCLRANSCAFFKLTCRADGNSLFDMLCVGTENDQGLLHPPQKAARSTARAPGARKPRGS